jgi:DNA polymerase (family 10)
MLSSSFEAVAHDSDSEGCSTETPALTNGEIAHGLERIAALLEHDGPKVALRRAAALIRGCERALAPEIQDEGVEAVHALGINYELCGVVTDWVRSGRLRWLEQLEARRRDAVARVPGIGPKLATELRDALGIVDLEGLTQAVLDGRLGQMLGFGPKRLKLVTGALLGRTRIEESSRQLPLLVGT